MDELKTNCVQFMTQEIEMNHLDKDLVSRYFVLASQYLLKQVLKVVIPRMVYHYNTSYEMVLQFCTTNNIPSAVTNIFSHFMLLKFKHVVRFHDHTLNEPDFLITCDFCNSFGRGLLCHICNFRLCIHCAPEGKNAGLLCPYIDIVCKVCNSHYCQCFQHLVDDSVNQL